MTKHVEADDRAEAVTDNDDAGIFAGFDQPAQQRDAGVADVLPLHDIRRCRAEIARGVADVGDEVFVVKEAKDQRPDAGDHRRYRDRPESSGRYWFTATATATTTMTHSASQALNSAFGTCAGLRKSSSQTQDSTWDRRVPVIRCAQ